MIRPFKVSFEHHRDALGIGESQPRISWKFEGTTPNWAQVAYELEIARSASPAPERYVVTSSQSVLVPWPGRPLQSREAASVRVRASSTDGEQTGWSDGADVEAGLLRPSDWKCSLIRCAQRQDVNEPHQPVMFRRAFHILSSVRSARLYITAHGLYDAEINGVPVGNHVLAPGWTSYQHELPYQTFDVLARLRSGENVLGVQVGEGWFAGRLGFLGGVRNIWGDTLGLIAQLILTYEDGTAETIATDETWKYRTGAILASEIYDGENYDARLEVPHWSSPECDEDGWHKVFTAPYDAKLLRAPDGPPIRRIQELPALKIWKSPSEKLLIDFGQNLVGWLRIRVAGPAGHRIKITHAEALENGELATRPLRLAKATDTLVLSGSPLVWEPRFTFHGFRYVQVDGQPSEMGDTNVDSLRNFTAVVIHTDMERTGRFRCSHPLLNQLHENVLWSMKGNFVGVPTDCPQRDERLGWTGDLQAFAPTASFLHSSVGMLKTWLRNLADEQQAEGRGIPPMFVPNVFRDKPHRPLAIWGDCTVLVPWDLYQSSGDVNILRDQYQSMVDWLEKGIPRDERNLWDATACYQLGDWLDPAAPPDEPGNGQTDADLVANAFLIHTTDIMSEISSRLGMRAEATKYSDDAAAMRHAFRTEYITASGRLVSDSQTAIALAIHFSLFSSREQEAVATRRLTHLIRSKARFKIATGFAGTPLLGHALTQVGHSQLFYRMLLHRKCPSWLYPVTMGATTTWERWDSMLPDGSINPGEMTSFNHNALGAVASWMHNVIGGLSALEPGWKRMLISPIPGGTLTNATVSLDSPYGMIDVSWALEGDTISLLATVPPNTTAKIVLPGHPAEHVGSGIHSFRVPYRKPDWPPLPIYPPFFPHDDDACE